MALEGFLRGLEEPLRKLPGDERRIAAGEVVDDDVDGEESNRWRCGLAWGSSKQSLLLLKVLGLELNRHVANSESVVEGITDLL